MSGARPEGGGRVDAHHHLWDVQRRRYSWMDGPENDPIRRTFAVSDLVAAATPHRISQTVVVQAAAEVAETRELLAMADDSTLIAGVVGWVDLTAPDVADAVAVLRAAPGGRRLVGIRAPVQDEPDPDWLRRTDVRRGLRAVAGAGLVYDLLVRPHQLPAARDAVQRNPDLSFVLDHLAKPQIAAMGWQPWASELARLAAEPNVVCKVSGLVTEAGRGWTAEQIGHYVSHAAAAFGPDRLMFGSDWPVCLLAADYSAVVDLAEQVLAGLPAGLVFAGTARRIYHLDYPSMTEG
jgi:L-fuconolactonase